MAANRIGKSFSVAHEFARHLTGNYDNKWNGHIVQSSGRIYWCIGVDLDSVANVMQRELLGTSDCRVQELLGTGAIPRECIVTDTGWQPDGPRLRSLLIKHRDGGVNTLRFYGSNNEANMMGQSTTGVWVDELPPHNDLRIYSQALTRTATHQDGFVIISATPEHGRTELIRMYQEDKSGHLYLQNATWDDAPHLNEKTKASLLAGFPEWQHDMRTKGLPVMGEGAVFDFADTAVKVEPMETIPSHWWVVHGVDFGMVNDPSVVSTVAYNPDSGISYLIDSIRLDGKEGRPERSPEDIARVILDGKYPQAPVIVPHDAGLNSSAPETKGKQLIDLGVNVHNRSFSNPTEALLEVDNNTWKKHNATSHSKEAGLSLIRSHVKAGTFKVCSNCTFWFDEKHAYFYKASPSGYKTSERDDHIDSGRYAFVGGILNNIYCSVAEATGDYKPSYRFNMGLGL